jgi:hypothetical protein
MASARRQRKRERRALGRAEQTVETRIQPPTRSGPERSTSRLCYRCAWGCRTEKPLYGWVCANCAYELDRHFSITLGLTGGDVVSAFNEAKRRGELPPPGPRGRGVNSEELDYLHGSLGELCTLSGFHLSTRVPGLTAVNQ